MSTTGKKEPSMHTPSSKGQRQSSLGSCRLVGVRIDSTLSTLGSTWRPLCFGDGNGGELMIQMQTVRIYY
jgi:hypothetical protein